MCKAWATCGVFCVAGAVAWLCGYGVTGAIICSVSAYVAVCVAILCIVSDPTDWS